MAEFETRTVTAHVEYREESDVPTVVGHAATFNQPYQVGFFNEQIHRDAFKRTLSGSPDVRLLINHEGEPLARTKSGTLTLGTDDTGLTVRAALDPSDPDVQRLVPKMRRGDMDQMSFAFRVPTGGDVWDHSGDLPMRTIREASLSGGDVSIVTYPANENASVSLRKQEQLAAAHTLFVEYGQQMLQGRPVDRGRLKRVLDALQGADIAPHDSLWFNDTTESTDAEQDANMDPAGIRATAEINDLPASDFAYIESGGEKDSEGKTTPRSLRHFPIHDAAHVRNALARASQSPFGHDAMPKILAAAKKFGIATEQNSGIPSDLALRIAAADKLRRSA